MARNDVKANGFSSVKNLIKHVDTLREEILDGICRNCGNKFDNEYLELGHIIPACRGGLYKKENLRPLCIQCNIKEGGEINEKFFNSIYHFVILFNNKKIKRKSGAKFKSGKEIAIINGLFFSEISNSWCFSTICGCTLECKKAIFIGE